MSVISYSGLVNYGTSTLPSVESWGTNMNILRDPPKAIMTRKIDKVGETSSITEMVSDSGNRACEAINVYARGINPSVSVSYGNQGNNGGRRSGGLIAGGLTQAFLPYTIAKDGAFRPPVRRQEDNTPLSRLPRVWTNAVTNPEFIDFSKKMKVCGTSKDYKEVKGDNMTLRTQVRPTAVYNVETPLSEPFEVKYVIQPAIKVSANAGLRTMDLTKQTVQVPTKEIEQNNIHVYANANIGSVRHVDNSTMNTDKYTQDTLPHFAVTNPSDRNNTTSIEIIMDNSKLKTRDIQNVSYATPISGVEQTVYLHEPIQLTRRLPEYSASTNIGKNMYKAFPRRDDEIILNRNTPIASYTSNPVSHGSQDIQSRDHPLREKIQPGGYAVPGNIPLHYGQPGQSGNQNEPTLNSDKSRMSKLVQEQFENRFLR